MELLLPGTIPCSNLELFSIMEKNWSPTSLIGCWNGELSSDDSADLNLFACKREHRRPERRAICVITMAGPKMPPDLRKNRNMALQADFLMKTVGTTCLLWGSDFIGSVIWDRGWFFSFCGFRWIVAFFHHFGTQPSKEFISEISDNMEVSYVIGLPQFSSSY